MKKITAILVLTLITSGILLAQKRTLLGINLTSNLDDQTNIKPEIGIIFERQVTNHSGIEMDLNYRTYQNEMLLIINNNSYYPLLIEKYISIPILYKFYSKIVKVGAGLTFDYNIGWDQKNTPSSFFLSYNSDYDYLIGPLVKLSREFHVDNDLVLEPELKGNFLIVPFVRTYLGLGITAKFDLHKN